MKTKIHMIRLDGRIYVDQNDLLLWISSCDSPIDKQWLLKQIKELGEEEE